MTWTVVKPILVSRIGQQADTVMSVDGLDCRICDLGKSGHRLCNNFVCAIA